MTTASNRDATARARQAVIKMHREHSDGLCSWACNLLRPLAALESAIREEERSKARQDWPGIVNAALRAERVRVLEEVQRRIGHADSWSGKQVAEMLSAKERGE